MIYRLAKNLSAGYFTIFNRREIVGRENIPREGGLLVVSNHISNLDPPNVGSGLPRRIHFMAKEELFQVPVLRWIIKDLGAFPVKRGAGDRQSIRTSIQLLEDGHCMGIFPEGTRSKSGQLEEAHSGAAFFALKTQAQVIPTAVIGSYKLFRKIKVVYGKPLDISAERELKGKEAVQAVTQKLMAAIEDLIEQHRS